jgi:hypothetical protein
VHFTSSGWQILAGVQAGLNDTADRLWATQECLQVLAIASDASVALGLFCGSYDVAAMMWQL